MEKIKQFINSNLGKDILVVFIVILVGLGSFLLGRLSKEGRQEGIKIEYESSLSASAILAENPALNNQEQIKKVNTPAGQEFFGSSRGAKYYPVDCSAGKSIKIENRIYFKSKEEAENKGYTLSTAC